jgi:hypothetical protein
MCPLVVSFGAVWIIIINITAKRKDCCRDEADKAAAPEYQGAVKIYHHRTTFLAYAAPARLIFFNAETP